MMVPIHPNGGGWAQEIALEAVKPQAKTLGTVILLLSNAFCAFFLFSALASSLVLPLPSSSKGSYKLSIFFLFYNVTQKLVLLLSAIRNNAEIHNYMKFTTLTLLKCVIQYH